MDFAPGQPMLAGLSAGTAIKRAPTLRPLLEAQLGTATPE